MSERDLLQKLDMRRAFWALGASTRLDVKLSALIRPEQRGGVASQEWTDLDVLAIEYSPISGLSTGIADCKTTKGRATERVIWLGGMARLFGAQAAYLVKDAELPPAARSLAQRLGITAMDRADRAEFVRQAGERYLPRAGAFFAESTVLGWQELIGTAPRATERLQRFRRAVYWVFPKHRSLTQLPFYLAEAASAFDPRQRWAGALLVDLAWMYLLSVLYAVDEVTKLHLDQATASLRSVLVGGELEMRDKEDFKRQLRLVIERLAPDPRDRPAEPDIVPPFFDDLVDLVAAAMRRRSHLTEALRILEFTSIETIANHGASWAEAFPGFDSYAAKVASDVVRFLCLASKVDLAFVKVVDDAVAGRILHNAQNAGTEVGARAASRRSVTLPTPARSAATNGGAEPRAHEAASGVRTQSGALSPRPTPTAKPPDVSDERSPKDGEAPGTFASTPKEQPAPESSEGSQVDLFSP